ncbi:MAG: OmpA family protein [Sulfuricaulis sp.]|uniref:OmpA family protein n=1 Tax=Sulfuricaulis sp. TaxID=2003553 RepID=UPI003C41787C
MKRFTVFAIIAAFVAVIAGCATAENGKPRPITDAEKGALAKKDDLSKDALIGAVGGGIAGAAVDTYMDSQKRDLEKVLAPEIQAIAIDIQKVNQNNLLITMTSQTAFDFDSTTIKPGFYSTMDKIANVLIRYGKTHLTIVGHTDNVGAEQYNQTLSDHRAQAVNDYLRNKGILVQRLVFLGRGATAPRASNATEEGRRLNRRVEIIVEPIVAEPQNQAPG